MTPSPAAHLTSLAHEVRDDAVEAAVDESGSLGGGLAELLEVLGSLWGHCRSVNAKRTGGQQGYQMHIICIDGGQDE